MTTNTDPIRKNYFEPMQVMERWLSMFFWIGATLSIISAVAEDTHGIPYSYIATVLFAIVIAVIFVITLIIRFHLSPRAADARRKDIIGNSFGINFDHIRVVGYYNNDESEPFRRMGLSVLENTFFTKSILAAMAPKIRIQTALLMIGWLALALFRETPILVVAVTAQIAFSAEILERWWRVEWLRAKCEGLYESFLQLFQSNLSSDNFSAYIVRMFGEYECAKSVSDVLLDEKIFVRDNSRLSNEWEQVKSNLPLTDLPPETAA